MRLTEEQSGALLAKHGVYVTEACDKCGQILGPVPFTRFREPGVWCSRECRDRAEEAARYTTMRKGGRPRRYGKAEETRQRKPLLQLSHGAALNPQQSEMAVAPDSANGESVRSSWNRTPFWANV